MSAHETSVWNRIAEGSQQAECTCGWKGPKRTAIAGLAYTDADRHTESALQRTTPECICGVDFGVHADYCPCAVLRSTGDKQ